MCPGTGSLLPSLSVTTREKSAEDPGRARALSIKITCNSYINNNTSSYDLSDLMHFKKNQNIVQNISSLININFFKKIILFTRIFLFQKKVFGILILVIYINIEDTMLSLNALLFWGIFFYPQSIAIWLTLEAGCPKLCGLNLGGHEVREMCVPEPKSTALSKISQASSTHCTTNNSTVLIHISLL